MADFAGNRQALATLMGLSYPWGENKLGIKSITFYPKSGQQETVVSASGQNQTSRAFIQHIAQQMSPGKYLPVVKLSASVITAAQEFFAEVWNDEPGTGKHAFLDLLRSSWEIRIEWKSDYITAQLRTTIEAAWEVRTTLTPGCDQVLQAAIDAAFQGLDDGTLRVAEKINGEWMTNAWLKQAALLSFRLNPNTLIEGGPGGTCWWDKVPSKFAGWGADHFQKAGFRAVPGSIVRHGAHIGKDVILMPSFVNIGANVGEGTMVDTWATIGSCAQIGRKCHISGGAGIGGVFEPLQATPVIIEDGCFIGARSEVAEGVIVGEGSVLGMGVFLTATSKIVDRKTGKVCFGRVPPYSVIVPGSLGGGRGKPALGCAVIIKTVDAQTRSKTSINELLRD